MTTETAGPTQPEIKMNTRVDLPSYKNFEIIGSHPDEIASKWKKWQRGLNFYIEATGIDKDAEKTRLKNMVLYLIGEDCQDIYDTLNDTGDDYLSVLETLNNYFVPPCNISYERHVFNSCKQEKGETMDSYVTRLKLLAKTCDFGVGVDERIRDQIIQGCFSHELRKTFLKTENLTLAIILKKAKMAELSEGQIKQMKKEDEGGKVFQVRDKKKFSYKNQQQSSFNKNDKLFSGSSKFASEGKSFRRDQNKQGKNRSFKCFRCDREGHFARSDSCPAKNKKCKSCGKIGHFAIVCRDSSQSEKVRLVKTEKQKEILTSKGDLYKSFHSSSSEEDIWRIDSNKSKSSEIEILINMIPMKFTIDSGAGVNIVDSYSYGQLGNIKLDNTNMKLYTYGSEIPLKLRGKMNCCVQYRDRSIPTEIYVVDSKYAGCLLGKDSAERLDILQIEKINEVKEETAKWTKETVAENFPDIVEGVGRLKDIQVAIQVDEKIRPVKQPYRRVPYHLTTKLEQKLKEFRDMDLIEDVEPGQTQWVSPMVIVPKPDGDIRVCIDMRQANKAIIREKYPIPTLEEICQDMHGSVFFSKLDLKMGYHQLELDENSRNITTFVTPGGLMRWKVLIMGVSTASEIYQYYLEQKVFIGLKRLKVISDDTIIYGRTQTEHDEALEKALIRIREKGLTLNYKKCQFNMQEIKFFGVILSKEGIRTDPDKVKAVEGLQIPKNKGELRSILGLTTYFSRFIKDYATRVEPLRELIRSKATWEWTERHTVALTDIKNYLSSAGVMAYWRPDSETRLTTDASPVGLGAILEQRQVDGEFRPIAYASRSLSDVERRYSQTEKEGLGIVWGCEKFELYLLGTKFDLFTDHKPLERIFSPGHKVSARIERWTLRLQPFLFTIKYIKGKNNPTDILSRMPLQKLIEKTRLRTEEYINQVIRYSLPAAITLKTVSEYSEKDPEIQLVRETILSGNWHENQLPPAYKQIKDELTVVDGVLLRQLRIVIPQGLRKQCLDLVHKNHMGIVRCKEHLRSKVWWPSIDKDVEKYIQECRACQLVGKESTPEPLKVSSLPDRPWQVINVDICGPFPNGDSLFTMMDSYSRFPEVVIIRCTKSRTLIRHMKIIFARLGFPEQIISDNGSNFISEEMKNYFKQCGIKHRKVVPYSPQSNGLIERFHRTLKKAIQTVHSEGRLWQDALHSFLMDYRSTVHASTNKTPASLMFGREIRTEIPAFHEKLKDQEVRERDFKSKQKMKNYFDENNKARKSLLQKGDIVLLRQNRENKLSTKFENKKYKIIDMKGNSVTICSKDGEMKVRNTREVKLFHKRKKGVECYKSRKVKDIYPSKMDELDDIEVEIEDREEEVLEDTPEVEVEEEILQEVPEVEREEVPVDRREVESEQLGRGCRNRHKPAHLKDFILTLKNKGVM